MTKNILLGLAAVPSCTYTGVDEVPVSLKMYLPLNSLHDRHSHCHTRLSRQSPPPLRKITRHGTARHHKRARASRNRGQAQCGSGRGSGHSTGVGHIRVSGSTHQVRACDPTAQAPARRIAHAAVPHARQTVPKPSASCLRWRRRKQPPVSSRGSTSDSALCRRRRLPAVRPQDQPTHAWWGKRMQDGRARPRKCEVCTAAARRACPQGAAGRRSR